MRRFLIYKSHSSTADSNGRKAAIPIEDISEIKDVGGGLVQITKKQTSGRGILAIATVDELVAQINA